MLFVSQIWGLHHVRVTWANMGDWYFVAAKHKRPVVNKNQIRNIYGPANSMCYAVLSRPLAVYRPLWSPLRRTMRLHQLHNDIVAIRSNTLCNRQHRWLAMLRGREWRHIYGKSLTQIKMQTFHPNRLIKSKISGYVVKVIFLLHRGFGVVWCVSATYVLKTYKRVLYSCLCIICHPPDLPYIACFILSSQYFGQRIRMSTIIEADTSYSICLPNHNRVLSPPPTE